MQLSAQEVKILFKLIVAAKDSWACFLFSAGPRLTLPDPTEIVLSIDRNEMV